MKDNKVKLSYSRHHTPVRWLWLSLAIIVLDQLTKLLVRSHMQLFDSVHLMPSLNLVLLHNTGAAFSFLAGEAGWQRWFFVGLAILVVLGILIWLRRMPSQGNHWMAAALALLAGGALGNVIDRVWHGYVIDFIQVYYRHWAWPAFNVADSAISIGAVMIIIDGLFLHSRRTRKQELP